MSVIDRFLSANEIYVENFGDKGSLAAAPALKVAIVTCMDARIVPTASLGIKEGDAHVIRSAGGLARDALRSLIISQQYLGTREILLFHHTECGMSGLTNAQVHRDLQEQFPKAPPSLIESIDFMPFGDLNIVRTIQEDVTFLKTHPLLREETKITGWVYDVSSGKIGQVV